MRNWLITGAGAGLGHHIAAAALARGDAVVGTMRKAADKEAFESAAPGRAFGLLVDLARPEDAAGSVEAAQALVGEIDVLVNNAGYGLTCAVEEASLDEIRRQFDVNVFSPIALIQAVLPAMRARRAGVIVNVTSVSGLAVWAGTGIYCASKHALEAAGETLADELEPLGVRVLNVAPGGIRTGFAGRSLVTSARRIEAYDGGPGHFAGAALSEHSGQESGDPARMAAAILAALDAPEPPRRLLLGADALHYAEAHIDDLRSDIDAWRSVSLGTSFEPASQ